MGNKLLEEKLHDPDSSEVFVMDSTGRLADPGASYRGIAGAFKRGTLNPAKTDIATLTARPGERQREDWTLDGTGNWVVHTFQDQGAAPITDDRRHSDFNEIFDRKIAANPNPLAHDPNGNTTDTGKASISSSQFPGGGLRLVFDAPGRLREVYKNNNTPADPSDDTLLSRALYAPDNRRLRKTVTNSGDLNGTTDYYYHGWRVLEERDTTDAPTQQYVYGNYLDEPWTLDNRRGAITVGALNDGAGSERHQYHSNTLYSAFGLTDEPGGLKEANEYDTYGRHTVILDGPDANRIVDFSGDDVRTLGAPSAMNNPLTYTAQREDYESRILAQESGLLYCRHRAYDAALGRFLSRDRIAAGHFAPRYEYAASSPTNRLDPMGLRQTAPGGISDPITAGGGGGGGGGGGAGGLGILFLLWVATQQDEPGPGPIIEPIRPPPPRMIDAPALSAQATAAAATALWDAIGAGWSVTREGGRCCPCWGPAMRIMRHVLDINTPGEDWWQPSRFATHFEAAVDELLEGQLAGDPAVGLAQHYRKILEWNREHNLPVPTLGSHLAEVRQSCNGIDRHRDILAKCLQRSGMYCTPRERAALEAIYEVGDLVLGTQCRAIGWRSKSGGN